MHEFQVFNTEWLIIALGGGAAAVSLVILYVFELWRPRSAELKGPEDGESTWREMVRSIPWVLILTFVGVAVYALLFTLMNIMESPNW